MTQAQLESAVAGATGEALSTVQLRGFSVLRPMPGDPDPEDLRLVVDCPTCRRPVDCPGRAGDGAPALAECPRCDAYFGWEDADVYATGPARPAGDICVGRCHA